MSITLHAKLAIPFCFLLLLSASPGCQWMEANERFDDAQFGEYGQTMRQQEGDSDGKWGLNGKSQQIEANLGI